MLNAVHDIIVSSAEIMGAFKTDLDRGNLHRPTGEVPFSYSSGMGWLTPASPMKVSSACPLVPAPRTVDVVTSI